MSLNHEHTKMNYFKKPTIAVAQRGYFDDTARGREFDRVEKEVQRNLFELIAIGNQFIEAIHDCLNLEIFVMRHLAHRLSQTKKERFDGDDVALDLHLAGFE